ncbi:MAG: hypothetical protein IT485_05775 [Gammaproteobacteria bacterium]|nr:hypothetical protein [Gammaproteobacteria bacterium]
MLQLLTTIVSPYYLYIKFLHVTAALGWVWSASTAYAYYLLPVMKAWRRNPGDAEIIPVRNWALERFEEAVIYEHVLFPIVLVTGPLMYLAAGFRPGVAWMDLKLLIVVGLFIPIEIMDYYMSHFGGNKYRIRASGDMVRYEHMVHRHWWLILVTTPAVMVYGLLIVLLAIAKPF